MLDRALTWFASIWFGLVLAANLLSIIGLFVAAPSIWDAIGRVQSVYSPFNLLNVTVELLSLSPGFLAILWRNRRRLKARS